MSKLMNDSKNLISSAYFWTATRHNLQDNEMHYSIDMATFNIQYPLLQTEIVDLDNYHSEV